MKLIKVTKGLYTLVDDDDYEELSKYKWYASKKSKNYDKYYIERRIRYPDGSSKIFKMHRIIMNAPPGKNVDHINGNPLDNRKCNLRLCSQSQNNMNSKLQKNSTTGYRGVSWHKKAGKWRAYINVNRKQYHLGLYDDINDAIDAYNKASIEKHGEYANKNKK